MKKPNRFDRCMATCTHPQGIFISEAFLTIFFFYQLEFVQLNKQFQTLLWLSWKQNRQDKHAGLCVASTSMCLVGVSLKMHEYKGGRFSPPVLFKEIRTVRVLYGVFVKHKWSEGDSTTASSLCIKKHCIFVDLHKDEQAEASKQAAFYHLCNHQRA